MKTLIFGFITFFAASFIANAQPSPCGSYPYPITINQPDGSTITVVGKGNADLSYTETTDGYTLVKNATGIYEYAVLSASGELTASGIAAHNSEKRLTAEQSFLKHATPHLRHSAAMAEQLKESATLGAEIKYKANQLSWGFPSSGKKKLLVILIQYPDLPSKFNTDTFTKFMNAPNFAGTGSFKDFYLENSFGKFEVEATVVGWYTAKNSYQNYARSIGNSATRPLIAEAIDSAEKTGVDFSQFDNDKDGELDGLIVIHAGNGAEQGSQTQFIWSHRWTLGNTHSRTYDGTKINEYCVTPETRSTNNMVGIGVFVHEFGHILGLPDLYDVSYNSEGIGSWGAMGGGNWLNNERTPCHFESWSKIQLGWQTPVVISQEKVYTLKAAADTNLTYKILTPNDNEFFLLENRQKIKFDAALPGKGMAIWHINTDKTSLYPGNNSVNADETDKGVGLKEADGYGHMDRSVNNGDVGDLFPGSRVKRIFDDNTTPSAKTNDGGLSNVQITEITEANGVISFYLGKRAPAGINGLNNQSVIQVYPNPVTMGSTITLTTNEPLENAVITITDLSGKSIYTLTQGDMQAGVYQLPINLTNAGIYMLVVDHAKGRLIEKLVTQK